MKSRVFANEKEAVRLKPNTTGRNIFGQKAIYLTGYINGGYTNPSCCGKFLLYLE